MSGTFFKVVKKVLCRYPPTLMVILSFLKTSNKLSPEDEILPAILFRDKQSSSVLVKFCFESITRTITQIFEISVNVDVRSIPCSESRGVQVLIKSHSERIV